MSKLTQLNELGQSIWYDNIRRALIDSGEIDQLVSNGVQGVTSNPSIFEKAIAGSSDYDIAINELAGAGEETENIYEQLAVADIQRGADALLPVYKRTNGADGFISLEVSPKLAHDTDQTVAEARRLSRQVDRPNLMIKVPATKAGLPAIRTLIGQGISINVTLVFSLQQYDDVAEAYISGLEDFSRSNGDLSTVSSVASFFVSRVDAAVDKLLEEKGEKDLQGRVAVANAKMAYLRSKAIFYGERWEALASKRARIQRLLWASTGTKNPSYSKTKYVDELIGEQTINTVPPTTLQYFLSTGTPRATLHEDILDAASVLMGLEKVGIDLTEVTDQLLAQGVDKFAKSYESLISSVALKKKKLLAEHNTLRLGLGKFEAPVRDALNELKKDRIIQRIWERDHTVWAPEPEEIANRLGWLDSPEDMQDAIPEIESLRVELQQAGFTDVLLLGMGGSSLAPEVFSNVFPDADGLRLQIVDSSDPEMIRDRLASVELSRTAFVVATKSGGTVETLSAFKFFYNQVSAVAGADRAGEHFIAITDPESKLLDIADKHNFRRVFVNDPNIGGRYSVLSHFGLVPAGLIGVDLDELLDRAHRAAVNAHGCNCAVDGDNNAAVLGTIIGVLGRQGRDKLTMIVSPALENFGDWAEQLVAESTGKNGKGILPVVGERLADPDSYGTDRLFVFIHLVGDQTHVAKVNRLIEAGHPVLTIRVDDRFDLGQQFFLWEMATAVVGYYLEIQPFDQPNVESAKVLARSTVQSYLETGTLPAGDSIPPSKAAINDFLTAANDGDYIAIQAYVNPDPEIQRQLQALRTELQLKYHLATTLGFGPRFLHSTGQLHKGDGGSGLFIQLVSSSSSDLGIPDEAGEQKSTMSFGILKQAQALGDLQALQKEGRRVISFDLGRDSSSSIQQLIN